MRDRSAFRALATCLIPSTAFTDRKKRATRNSALPLAALLLLLGGSAPGYTQNQPVMHRSIVQPSSAPAESSQVPGPLRSWSMVQPNLTPVNTGPGVVFTCNPNVATATCNYLNTTVAGYYNATFTNANANIYVQYGSTGLGSSEYYFNYVTYSQYVTAYGNIANKSAIQTAAQSALSTYDATPYGSSYVWIQPGIARALGITAEVQGGAVGSGLGLLGIQTNTNYCNAGTAGCYDGIITVTNDPGITLYYDNLGGSEPAGAYDFYAVVQHETDEVLGTSSCVSTQNGSLSDPCGTGRPSIVDLFRYSSAGHLVLDSSLSTTPGAYFSYNGGSTNGANGIAGTPKVYNTLANSEDYADYVSSSPCSTDQAIQDAEGCPGADAGLTILNDGGSVVNILTADGYGVPSGTSPCTNPNLNPNPNPTSFANPGDYNNDCKTDILWRNSGSGQLYTWLMNGATITNQQSPGTVATSWNVVGEGDFDGDGKADILWRNSSSGQLYLWLMNGATITNQQSPGTVATVWNIVGIGDFDGDGKADILWRNSSTGQLYLWLMNGVAITSQQNLGIVALGWNVVGLGDFNGDGKADILWRNSSSGQLYLWFMNGATITNQQSPGTVATSWNVVGVGDFDGDGKSDIVWQNPTTGQVYLWFMNGTTITNQQSPGTVASPWSIVGIGDFNGDGKADFLWRNTSTGQVYMWLMNGTTIANQTNLGTVSTDWQIVAQVSP